MLISLIEFFILGILTGYLYLHCLKCSIENATTSISPIKTYMLSKLLRVLFLGFIILLILKLDGINLIPFVIGIIAARNLVIGRYIMHSPVDLSQES